MMAGRKRKRAGVNPMGLAFLDVMSCGFGAVVLIFLILDHTATEDRNEVDPNLTAEARLLQEEVLEGEEQLFQVRNTLDEISLEVVEAQGLADRIQNNIDDFMAQLAALEGNSMATEESLEDLRADIQSLEEELLRLQTSAVEEQGDSSREFLGDGDRQYLTGMFLGGNRILILLDTSASMLDASLVNIIRIRNMSDDAKLASAKWQRAVRIVEWISSQLPLVSQYQVIGYNESAEAIMPGTDGRWLEVADRDELNEVVRTVQSTVPGGGNNLQRAFEAVAAMNPRPDNVYLITDSLPTQGSRSSNATTISPRQRLELYQQALNTMPANIPVNTILLPMEGDPAAAAAYWQLGVLSGGSFITPARDWP
ncbi:vWA domain-containing protein [Pseudohongiella acticola]|jgi:von Willebrand factor type A domain|uniref:vWA domain-containing protein n=1 Tax=Pseudohongiella acticola TaxID=1524254 RepID=UPI0030ED402E